MAMYGKVRRMRYRDGLSISEIARRTSLSRNTIKTWLREPVRSGMTYRRPGGPCKLGAHADWFAQALEADARRPRKERRTALRLLAQLREQGYGGGYSQVTAFIRSWRAKAGAVTARSGYVPLRFDWGEVRGPEVPQLIAQVFDWPMGGQAKMTQQPGAQGFGRVSASNRASCSGVVLLTPR